MPHVVFDDVGSPGCSVQKTGKVDRGNGHKTTDLLSRSRFSGKRVVCELNKYFGKVTKPEFGSLSWPDSVAERWSGLNKVKSGDELGLLSWNVNGRLELRGCRESLLRRGP